MTGANIMNRIALAILALLIALPAHAQAPKRAPVEPAAATPQVSFPCLQPIDPRPSCHNGIFAPSGVMPQADGSPGATQANPTCDFGTFTVLTPQNLTGIIQACGQKLVDDSQAALDSATTAKDTTAMSCLTPGTALFKAAVGTPATPGDANANPPVPATPGKLGGPILLFQKYREFVNAGGISACESWVNTVVAAQVGSIAGAAGAVAGAAVLVPKIP